MKTQVDEINGWKVIYHANSRHKKCGGSIFISDKSLKHSMTIYKEKYVTMIKGLILQTELETLNFYAPKN